MFQLRLLICYIFSLVPPPGSLSPSHQQEEHIISNIEVGPCFWQVSLATPYVVLSLLSELGRFPSSSWEVRFGFPAYCAWLLPKNLFEPQFHDLRPNSDNNIY